MRWTFNTVCTTVAHSVHHRCPLHPQELTLTFGSLVLGTLAVLVGLFGTNTLSGLENSQFAFASLAVLCVVLVLMVWIIFGAVAKSKGLRASWLL